MKELLSRRALLKRKFLDRKDIFGAWTSLYHPSITEIFCKASFDFIGIDIEHSSIDQEQSQRIIAAAQAMERLCLPRIPTHDIEIVKRLLDSGADGLIVPMVSSKEQIDEISSWMRYPPEGSRSYGVARAHGYGFDFEEYTREWNKVCILIAQIETIEAVDNIEDIVSNPNVDGIMIGPYDLSGSLGIPGELEHRKVREACQHVLNVCIQKNKSCGTQIVVPDKKGIDAAFNQGFNFVVLASDIFILWKWSETMDDLIHKHRMETDV